MLSIGGSQAVGFANRDFSLKLQVLLRGLGRPVKHNTQPGEPTGLEYLDIFVQVSSNTYAQ